MSIYGFNMSSKTGFDAFQAKCRYVRESTTKIRMEDFSKREVAVPFCYHKDSLYREKGKKYAPACLKENCPFYKDKAAERH